VAESVFESRIAQESFIKNRLDDLCKLRINYLCKLRINYLCKLRINYLCAYQIRLDGFSLLDLQAHDSELLQFLAVHTT
jgi:hypothetical protein